MIDPLERRADDYFASTSGTSVPRSSAGFYELIFIWGQDDHGTVARVRKCREAMGYDRPPCDASSPGFALCAMDRTWR